MRNILAISIAAALTGCGFQTVDTGHRGVKTTFGKVVSESLPEGLYFYNPFTSDIVEFDTRVLRWEGTSSAYTRDVQSAQIDFVVNYRLHQEKVHVTYREVGKDWAEVLMPQVVLGAIKNEVGQQNAVDMIAARADMQNHITETVRAALITKDIDLERFEVTDITFDKNFEQAVEQKVIAQQEAIREHNRTVQIEEQAIQTVKKAEAEAQSMTIRAQALEQNAKLVEWEAVQRWDGKLPTMMLGDAVPFIQLKQ